jgi:hypothetical protein
VEGLSDPSVPLRVSGTLVPGFRNANITSQAVRSDNWASALDQADQHSNHRQDEQDVNKASQRVRTDHAQQPEDQEQNSYRPEHRHSFPEAVCQVTTALEYEGLAPGDIQ